MKCEARRFRSSFNEKDNANNKFFIRIADFKWRKKKLEHRK